MNGVVIAAIASMAVIVGTHLVTSRRIVRATAPTCSPPADPPATASENGMNRPTYADGPAGGNEKGRRTA